LLTEIIMAKLGQHTAAFSNLDPTAVTNRLNDLAVYLHYLFSFNQVRI